MAIEYERNLRGKLLAKQVLNLNGHQNDIRFVFFNPIWFFMIISGILAGLIPLLKYVAIIGLLGALFELVVWIRYFIATKRFNAYPGLKPWLMIKVRRNLMTYGRSSGRLSEPR